MKYDVLADIELRPDEPYFLLRGQDVLAPHAILAYASMLRAAAAGCMAATTTAAGVYLADELRSNADDVERIAGRMIAWQAENGHKLPD